jgi:hypothetical protein
MSNDLFTLWYQANVQYLGGIIRNLARKYGRKLTDEDVQDHLQDAWIKLASANIDFTKNPKEIKGFAGVVIGNMMRDVYRMKSKRIQSSQTINSTDAASGEDDDWQDAGFVPSSGNPDPERILIAKEECANLARKASKIGAIETLVALATEERDDDHAIRVGASVSAVRVRKNRLRKVLAA